MIYTELSDINQLQNVSIVSRKKINIKQNKERENRWRNNIHDKKVSFNNKSSIQWIVI